MKISMLALAALLAAGSAAAQPADRRFDDRGSHGRSHRMDDRGRHGPDHRDRMHHRRDRHDRHGHRYGHDRRY